MRCLLLVLACSLAMLAACGDNLAGPGTIGGTVTGLEGTGLVLLDNGGDALQIDSDGAFTFATPIAAGATYAVTVGTQPSAPTQSCVVSNGQGVVSGAAITNITVTCQTGTFTVGGTVTGLTGAGLVLQNNGGDDLAINADGTFTFATPIASAASFAVTVLAQPSSPTQTCTVTNGTGSVTTAPVTSVTVTCSTDAFTVGGTVTGLAGTGLVLRNNGGDDLPIAADGTFTFATPVASGATYAVTVSSQPLSPSQTCTVTAGGGSIGGGPVTSVAVACTTNAYTIGGTVTGVVGDGLVLRNNGGDDLPIAADGTFTFATPVASGATFDVTVLAQPAGPTQTCTVGGGTGIVGGGAVTSVAINCTTNKYLVGGTVTGLEGTGLVLQNSGGDDAPIAADGTFAFATPIASGSDYEVTVAAQPLTPAQTCTVTAGTGTVGSANVTSVQIECTTNEYPVAGTLSGLATGDTVVLKNNGEALPLTGDGPFTFTTPIASGQTFNVTVSSQPDAPISQTCTVTGGSGTIGNTPAASAGVVVTCTINSFTIGGTVTGSVQPVTLRDNGGDDLPVTINGSFTFTTSVPSGQPYAVTVASSPGQQCTVTNGSGTVGAADVTDVIVSCVLGPFTTSGLPVDLPGTTSNPYGAFTFDGGGNLLAVTGGTPNKLYIVSRATDAITSVDLGVTSDLLVSIAYRAADNTVYFGSGYSGTIYSWNLTTGTGGAVTTVAGVFSINGLAFAPPTAGAIAGQLCAATYSNLGDGKVICVDLSTNAQTTIATVALASAIAFSEAGDAYIADHDGSQIVRVSPGQAPVQFATGVGGPDGLAIDEGRARLYVADSNNGRLYYIPLAGGSPVAFASAFGFDSGYWPSPLAFDGFSTLLYAVTPGTPTSLRATTVP